MSNSENIEEILINKTSMDDLINMKIENEFKKEIQNSKNKNISRTIMDIAQVPEGKVFSRQSTFRVFNKANKTETLINGIQAEGMLGLQDSVRQKLMNGEISTFATEDAYVRFEKACLIS